MAHSNPHAVALFGAPNFVHVATLMPDGSPHSVPVWARVEDGRVWLFTQPTAQKARNLARDQRIALSVVDRENPYRSARARGRVVEMLEGEGALAVIDRISRDYIGEDFPMRSGVAFGVEVKYSALIELPFSEPASG